MTSSKTLFAPALLATLIGSAFLSSTSLAANTPDGKTLATSSSAEQQIFGHHHQKTSLSPLERKPQVPSNLTARQSYGGQDNTPAAQLKRPSTLAQANKGISALAATCDTNLFATSTGSALVNAVKASTTDCVNQLFNVTGSTATSVFNENQMVTIANAFKTSASSYNGSNTDSTLQLVLFLRAGYYVNYYNSSATGAYGSRLKSAIQGAMDAFVNHANFGLVNDAHGETLSEFVILVDSATENARYLNSVVKRLLTGYNSSYNNYWWMKSAVNNAFTILFRGHQNADFKALVQSDTSIVDTLYSFINNNFNLLGGDLDYLIANAGRETGRFLQYTEGSALKNLAKARTKALIDRSNVTGSTASLWVGVGEMVDYFDKANCSYYSLCDFKQKLETAVLPISHSCSPTLRLRAQALTSAQLNEACTIVGGEEGYFHTQVASGKVPVANDNNSQLEMVVFKSSKDYQTYAGSIFGIDTNNGGMYLEGNPATSGNQPRFIAYQAEWMLPKFEIWNLTHEYIHYLDGRFNMYGDFNAAMGVKSVWWIEGFAEYMSYSYRNLDYTGAKNEAAAGTYNLSTIFNNDYNSGQTRVYNWGYLAVRYMFEKQRPKVSSVLGYFRPGNYSGYTSYMGSSNMGSSMDASFKAWLPCVNNASLPGCGGTTPGNTLPVAKFTSSTSGLLAKFIDQSTDSDGSIVSRSWNFGDNSAASSTPSHTYAASGTYPVTLTVTDNAGGKASVTQNVTVSNSTFPECPGTGQGTGRNCVRSNLSGRAGDYSYLWVLVPAGTPSVRITSYGGTGNADLYGNTSTWATRSAYQYGSFGSTNSETITFRNPPAGYIYFSLYGQAAYSGVTVKVEY
ncbi:MAG: hypothetical protein RL748_4607 [Pseudomonadota bacterium]